MSATASLQAVESLRQSLRPGEGNKGDSRFEFGTDYSANFLPPPQEVYNYSPLPAVYNPEATTKTGRHLATKTGIFPRLRSSIEEVKAKLAPVHTELTASLRRLDVAGSGYINMEALEMGLKETGVFLSKADVNELVNLAPRSVSGDIGYGALLDAIINKSAVTVNALTGTQLVAMPSRFDYPHEDALNVSLRLHASTDHFQVPAARMKEFAVALTEIRAHEPNPEKVHTLIRHHLLLELLITPGPAGNPDLSFRQWLMYNGVLARQDTTGPGVIPPEVYEVLNQIVAALGLPEVGSATRVPTELGASLRHTTTRRGA